MADPKDRPKPYPKLMRGVSGLLSRNEAVFLYETPARLGDGMYADLGTHHGRSAICLAGGLKDNNIDGRIVTVDCYDGRGLKKRFKRVERSIDTVNATLKEKEVSSYVMAVHGLTAETAADYQDKEFVFVFIDAEHTYESCKADFEAWSPLVKSGGEIAFHDTHKPEVNKVLEEIGWERYNVETIGVLKKP